MNKYQQLRIKTMTFGVILDIMKSGGDSIWQKKKQ